MVDNASADGTIAAVREKHPDVEIVENDKNVGYAAAINRGAAHSAADYLVLSNSDVIYSRNSIATLINYLDSHPSVGAAGPQQYYPDGRWQYSFSNFPGALLAAKDFFFISSIERWYYGILDKFGLWNSPLNVSYIDGAVIAVPRKIFLQAGGFDESYFFYSEETDFCRKLKQMGKKRAVIPRAKVVHYRGGSFGSPIMKEKNIRMQVDSQILYSRKWLGGLSEYIFLHLYKYTFLLHAVIHTLLLPFIGKERRRRKRRKINMLHQYYNIWKEKTKTDKNIPIRK
jgi:GT2 family glycosyltransferase